MQDHEKEVNRLNTDMQHLAGEGELARGSQQQEVAAERTNTAQRLELRQGEQSLPLSPAASGFISLRQPCVCV